MRPRTAITILIAIALITLAILGGCSWRRKQPKPDILPTPESAQSMTIFPGAETTPLPTAAALPQIVRPLLPTVSADNLPTPLPGEGEPPTPVPGSSDIPSSLRDTENILVLGSDQRSATGAWRTDVIMIVALDYKKERMGVISLPRDLWVQIPGVGNERINTADFYGSLRKDKNSKPRDGVELLKETLRQNMGIPIQHYVRVDFNVFKSAVDALGGITITVDCPLDDPHWDTPGQRWQVKPGETFMQGEDALRFVRTRHVGTDLDRARRQQRALLAMRDRALQINIWPRIHTLYRVFRDNVITDLGPLQIIELAQFGMRLRPENIHGFVVGRPMVRDWVTGKGAMVLLPDFRQIRSAIEAIFNSPPLALTNDRSGRCPQ
jgi:LCP family protein required for cell wall assembly